jgi:hypothetical protein
MYRVPVGQRWSVLRGVGDRHLDGDDQPHRVGSVLQGDLACRVRDGAGDDPDDDDDNNNHDDDDHNVVDDGADDDEHYDDAVIVDHHNQHHAVIDRTTLAPGGVDLR